MCIFNLLFTNNSCILVARWLNTFKLPQYVNTSPLHEHKPYITLIVTAPVPEYLYKQCYIQAVSPQSMSVSGKVWFWQDILFYVALYNYYYREHWHTLFGKQFQETTYGDCGGLPGLISQLMCIDRNVDSKSLNEIIMTMQRKIQSFSMFRNTWKSIMLSRMHLNKVRWANHMKSLDCIPKTVSNLDKHKHNITYIIQLPISLWPRFFRPWIIRVSPSWGSRTMTKHLEKIESIL